MSEPIAVVDEQDEMGAALAELRDNRSTEVAGDAVVLDKPVAADDANAPDAVAPATANKTLTPEQELANKKAELHRLTSEIGRVNALNRKNLESGQRIAELERELQSSRKPPETQAEARTRLEELSEQVKDFPELYSIVTAVNDALKESEGRSINTAKQAAQEAIKPLEPLRRQHQDQMYEAVEAAKAADMSVFSDSYPEAIQIIKTDKFREWLPKQPQAIQYSFHKGETAAEALTVMDAYDAHLRRNGQPSIAHVPQPQQSQAATEASRANNRLTRAAGIPTRSSPSNKGGIPSEDDFEGSLDYFRKQRLQQQARA